MQASMMTCLFPVHVVLLQVLKGRYEGGLEAERSNFAPRG